jgi:hypothetical protein
MYICTCNFPKITQGKWTWWNDLLMLLEIMLTWLSIRVVVAPSTMIYYWICGWVNHSMYFRYFELNIGWCQKMSFPSWSETERTFILTMICGENKVLYIHGNLNGCWVTSDSLWDSFITYINVYFVLWGQLNEMKFKFMKCHFRKNDNFTIMYDVCISIWFELLDKMTSNVLHMNILIKLEIIVAILSVKLVYIEIKKIINFHLPTALFCVVFKTTEYNIFPSFF